MEMRVSGEYYTRYNRLLNVFRNVCEQLNMSPYLLESRINSLEDHKGELTVSWRMPPTQEEISLFNWAWDKIGNECDQAVCHLYSEPGI